MYDTGVLEALQKGKEIYVEKGLLPAAWAGLKWIAGPVFRHEEFYLYHKSLNGQVSIPNLNEYELQIVEFPRDSEELISKGYNLKLYKTSKRRDILLIEGVAFYLFRDKQLVAEIWLLNVGFRLAPFKTRILSFLNFVSASGPPVFADGIETHTAHRRKGLQRHLSNIVFSYLRKKGLRDLGILITCANLPSRTLWGSLGAVALKKVTFWKVFKKEIWRLQEIEK